MDGQSAVAVRDIKRDFRVNRHSLSMIAMAFQLLCPDERLSEPDGNSVQVAPDPSLQPQLQEAH